MEVLYGDQEPTAVLDPNVHLTSLLLFECFL